MAVEKLLGSVPELWEYTTLGAACEQGGGDIQTGPFGSQLHASDYVPVGIPSIMPQNIGDNRILEDGIARITPEDAKRLSRYLVCKGDIVYSRRGDVERRALVREHEDGWLCGTGCLRVRLGEKGVDPRYASFYLSHPGVREWIVRHAHGATMPNLNTSILSACPFLIPPPLEQRAIAHTLSTLDDKIELNRRMNETLEAMARALFKSWFVDFDPVRAKAEGRDTGLPKEIADLFPDSFEESEMGEIPRGWNVSILGDVVETIKGRSYKSEELAESNTALVTLKSFARGGGYRPDGLKSFTGTYRPEQIVNPGELVIACTDVTQAAEVIGRPVLVRASPVHKALVASLDTMIVRPRFTSVTRSFLYFLMGTQEFVDHTYAHTTGTTVLHLAKGAVPSYKFVCPTAAAARVFDNLACSVLDRIQSNEQHSRTLSTIRDTLLPKLISGELRLKDAEPFIGRVA